MEKTVIHERYGEIVYRENFWSGKKDVVINGTQLSRKNKNTFLYWLRGRKLEVRIEGNFLAGIWLSIEGERVDVREKTKWFEYALSVFIFAFVIVWGNVPALLKILPLIGGMLGGVIGAIMGMANLFFMRKTEKIAEKLLIFVVFLALTVLICYLLALLYLSLAKNAEPGSGSGSESGS